MECEVVGFGHFRTDLGCESMLKGTLTLASRNWRAQPTPTIKAILLLQLVLRNWKLRRVLQ